MSQGVTRRTALAAGAASLVKPAFAQGQWPPKPVRIIVPYPAGGVGDLGTRAFASRWADRIGQPVVVENLPGGTQIIGISALNRAPADGQTLALVSPTSLVLNPALRTSLPYAPEKLALVSRLFSSPLFVIASNSLPASNVRELVAYAKAHPDTINYASTGEGSATHLATALFAETNGIRMVHVPYKGSANANGDLVSGRIQLHFDPGAGTLQLVSAGKLKVLAVSGAERSKTLPQVPTAIESGAPGYDVVSWWGLAAPEGAPPALAQQIAASAARVAAEPALAEQGLTLAIDYGGSTPEQFQAFVASERQRWGGVIRVLGLKAE